MFKAFTIFFAVFRVFQGSCILNIRKPNSLDYFKNFPPERAPLWLFNIHIKSFNALDSIIGYMLTNPAVYCCFYSYFGVFTGFKDSITILSSFTGAPT
jgi:hypothetical protein